MFSYEDLTKELPDKTYRNAKNKIRRTRTPTALKNELTRDITQ